MKLSYAMLIAGIVASIGGSIALLTSTFFSSAASGASAQVATWDGGGLWVAPGAPNRSDGPVGVAEDASRAAADQAVAVVLARMLHRSDAGKASGS
jgi:hypothetical protein